MRVVMVAYPDFQMLDVTGPLEVFSSANRRMDARGDRRSRRYELELVAREPGTVRATSGLELAVQRTLAEVRGPLDTLIVAGGDGTAAALRDRELVDFIRRTAPRARRVASVCSGSALLARAGLLDGRRATSHWAVCAELARAFPKVQVETDPIFVRDGKYWTSAGVCSGMDLALALLEQDHGREVALDVARWLVVFLKRPGGQAQFSTQLAAQSVEHDRVRRVQTFAHDHLDADLSIAGLAKRAAMSPRNFARVFGAAVGDTPARWIEAIRVEAARRALEETDAGVEEVAAQCGFGSAETLRRAFLRRVRVSPAAYRTRFRSPTES